MSIALSRTGVSTLRMQAAARALLTHAPGDPDEDVVGMTGSACQLQRDGDQIAHALRFIADMKQAVSLTAPDLRHSIRARMHAVEQRAGAVLLVFPDEAVDGRIAASRCLLIGRFLDRPLVCAVEPVGHAVFRLVMPVWMLLAEQRQTYRVKPSGCHLLTPWGETATVADLAEEGLAINLLAPPPQSIQSGNGWSGLLLPQQAGAAIPLYLTAVNVRCEAFDGIRIGARLHAAGADTRQRLRRLIRCHANLFGDLCAPA